jgi:hypothetical protein
MQVNNQPTNNDQFLKLPYDFLEATGFVGKGGEIVDITLQQKIIYCWMKQRCEFFARDKREYFDNVDDIANSVRINRKTVMGAIQLFKDNGVLIANKKPLGGAREKWVFKSFSELRLVDTKKKESAPSKAPQKAQPAQPIDDIVLAGAEWASEAVPDDVYEGFVQELDDDGSYADAFSYCNMSEVPETVVVVNEEAPATIHGVSLACLPTRRFKPNGEVSEEFWKWCEDKGIKIVDDEWDGQNFIINGVSHRFQKNTFVPCFESKPARKQALVEEFQDPF